MNTFTIHDFKSFVLTHYILELRRKNTLWMAFVALKKCRELDYKKRTKDEKVRLLGNITSLIFNVNKKGKNKCILTFHNWFNKEN